MREKTCIEMFTLGGVPRGRLKFPTMQDEDEDRPYPHGMMVFLSPLGCEISDKGKERKRAVPD